MHMEVLPWFNKMLANTNVWHIALTRCNLDAKVAKCKKWVEFSDFLLVYTQGYLL